MSLLLKPSSSSSTSSWPYLLVLDIRAVASRSSSSRTDDVKPLLAARRLLPSAKRNRLSSRYATASRAAGRPRNPLYPYTMGLRKAPTAVSEFIRRLASISCTSLFSARQRAMYPSGLCSASQGSWRQEMNPAQWAGVGGRAARWPRLLRD